MVTFRGLLCAGWLATVCIAQAAAADLEPAGPQSGLLQMRLEALQSVGRKGVGNRQAARAWEQVVQADAAQLPVILAAMDHAGPLAANWIRTAVDTIAERQLRGGGKLPATELERFVLDRQHDGRARRLAYEWLLRVDPTAEKRLIPGMLDDPSLEMRRDAVARLIDEGAGLLQAERAADAVAVHRRALSAARDLDQIRLLAGRLRDLGQKVDLARHFGFLTHWKLIGPFDNTDGKGYDIAYPPEREINLGASYQGKQGTVRWIDYVSTDDYGTVDFNKPFGEKKGVVGYATTEFYCQRRQELELRLASFNAVKLWLNGKLIHQRNVYHMGSQMDQFLNRTVLREGRNVILVKVCQNERTEDWARYWDFKLRVCDSTGGAVLSADRVGARE